MNWFVRILAIAMLSTANLDVRAQEIGNPSDGLAFAKQVCSGCHAVEKSAEHSPNLDAPTFEEIATTPGMTAAALSAALQTSHSTMPNLVLRDDMANVVAYILSLKRRS
jgi:mono/diheme cytochrome c family protein